MQPAKTNNTNYSAMRIAILGTLGIPGPYHEIEQYAEHLARAFAQKGHQVLVYSAHDHPYQHKKWNEVSIVHVYKPQRSLGQAGLLLYHLNCIRDVIRQNCDVVLQLGPNGSVWGSLLEECPLVITSIGEFDGCSKTLGVIGKKLTALAEKSSIKYSNGLVSNSDCTQKYLLEKHQAASVVIPYGAYLFKYPNPFFLDDYFLKPYTYDMFASTLKPDSSIEMVLDGAVLAGVNRQFLVIGNDKTKFGKYLRGKYKSHKFIKFLGAIQNNNRLNNLRYYSNLYFHGNLAGSHPSQLVEAMASTSLISAFDSALNRSILNEEGLYFTHPQHVCDQLRNVKKADHLVWLEENTKKINQIHAWEKVAAQYETYFQTALQTGKTTIFEKAI